MARQYPVLDLSSTPPLTLIDVPDEEAIIARRMALLKARWTFHEPPLGAAYDVEGTEFDPIKINQEVGTSFEMNGLTRINQMGRATTLASAWGDNLDAIGARLPGGALRLAGFQVQTFQPGVPRLNKGLPNEETDERYRYRLWLSQSAYTSAGAELAYVFWALTAVPTLRDATAIAQRYGKSRQPVARITCLADRADPVPTAEELDGVRRVLALPGIGPLTEIINVDGPAVIEAPLKIQFYRRPGPDSDVLLSLIRSEVAALIEEHRYLGADTSRNQIARVVEQPGVSYSVVEFPDLVTAGPTEFVRFGTPSITMMGIR